MGMFNTYGTVQLKVGELTLKQYNVGDKADIPDGAYWAQGEGVVIVLNGIFIVEFPNLYDYWGDTL